MSDIQTRRFSYTDITDKETRTYVQFRIDRCASRQQRMTTDIIEHGKDISELKAKLEHGLFTRCVEDQLGLPYSTAYNFMRVYEAFKSLTVGDLSLPARVLYALASPSVDDETREVAVELAQSGDLTNLQDVKALIEINSPPKSSTVRDLPSGTEAPSSPVDDDFDDSDPFEEDTPAPASIPGLTEDDFDDSDPFEEDSVESEATPDSAAVTEGFGPPPVVPPVAAPVTTVEKQDEAPAPKPLAERLQECEVYVALSLFSHGASRFAKQAELREAAGKAVGSAGRLTGALKYNSGPVSEVVSAMANLPDWTQWEGCTSCHGSTRVGERHDPCQSCSGSGFTIHPGQGVGPNAIRRRAQSLDSE